VELVTQPYVVQEMSCHLTVDAALRCRHDSDGTLRGRDFTVVGNQVIATNEGHSAPTYTVEPAPETDDQRRRILFVVALRYLMWGVGSHDGTMFK
jgi:hypothetical protein